MFLMQGIPWWWWWWWWCWWWWWWWWQWWRWRYKVARQDARHSSRAALGSTLLASASQRKAPERMIIIISKSSIFRPKSGDMFMVFFSEFSRSTRLNHSKFSLPYLKSFSEFVFFQNLWSFSDDDDDGVQYRMQPATLGQSLKTRLVFSASQRKSTAEMDSVGNTKCKDAKMQRCKNAKMQRRKNAKKQRYKDAKMQSRTVLEIQMQWCPPHSPNANTHSANANEKVETREANYVQIHILGVEWRKN